MTRDATVLVTAVGTVIAEGIIKSLRYANSKRSRRVSYRIVTADMSAQAAGLYRGDRGVLVPPASSGEFVESIIMACKREGADAIFVGSDEELSVLAGSASRIEKESGALVMTNSTKVISTGKDKWRTFEFLKKNGLPRAESALPGRWRSFVREFGLPVVVKPREGHGSLQLHIANSREEVEQAIKSIQIGGGRPILQQYLKEEDEEYTSGVMSDRRAKVISSISMRRRLKGGRPTRRSWTISRRSGSQRRR